MKEYGGFLPLDRECNEYYRDCEEYQIKRINAARYAIVEAFFMSGCSHIFVPVYTCHSVVDVLNRYSINFSYYNIDNNLMPSDVLCTSNDMILVINYFGIKNAEYYNEIVKEFDNIIFDNTQAFYASPIIENGIYNIYSPRKFFGVSDGAYIIGKKLKRHSKLKKDYSASRANYLMSSLEVGTNAVYSEFMKSEEDISNSEIREMSFLTKSLLGSINYGRIKHVRRRNFELLHSLLDSINELGDLCDITAECVPMVYPFFFKKKELREYLINNRIYVSQWWKWIIEEEKANTFERDLSIYMIPVPIDQRYNKSDMEHVAAIIKEGLK